MIILYDCSPFQVPGFFYHGGGEYARSLLLSLIDESSIKKIILINFKPHHNLERIKDIIKNNYLEIRFTHDLKKIPKNSIFISSLPNLNSSNFAKNFKSIFICFGLRNLERSFSLYEIIYINNFKMIIGILKKIIFLKKFKKNKLKEYKDIYRASDNISIVVISEWGKKSFKYYLGNANIKVIQPPPNDLIKYVLEKKIYQIDATHKNKILFISVGRWIKDNIPTMIRLFYINKKYDNKLELISVGKLNFFWKKILTKLKFIIYEDINKEQLSILYLESRALIYPTLNEGYGYPVIEGILHKCHVYCKAVSALSEFRHPLVNFYQDLNDLEIKVQSIFDDTYSIDDEDLYQENSKIIESFNKFKSDMIKFIKESKNF